MKKTKRTRQHRKNNRGGIGGRAKNRDGGRRSGNSTDRQSQLKAKEKKEITSMGKEEAYVTN